MSIIAGAKVDAGDLTRYFCKATQSSVQSIPNNAFTAIQFNGTDDTDSLGLHDPVTNNSRFVIGLKLGWWQVSGKYVSTGSAVAQTRRTRIVLNGSTGVNGGYSGYPAFTATGISGGFWTTESNTIVQSTVSTDYVELHGLQDSGGAQNTTVSGDLRCQFVAIYLGP